MPGMGHEARPRFDGMPRVSVFMPVVMLTTWLILAACAGQPRPAAGARNSEMVTAKEQKSDANKPAYMPAIEAAYGAPSQAGFGSAVFFEPILASDDLAQAALAKYKYFTGELWARLGEEAWMGPWKEVYTRPTGAEADIVAELRGIADPDAQNSVPMILENIEGAEKARAALAVAYDDPAVTELRVFNLGDGEAMSGILVAGRRGATGEATFLVFLLD